MKPCVLLAVLPLGWGLASAVSAGDVPTDAKDQIDQFQRDSARIRAEAEAKVAAKKDELIDRLRGMQAQYTKDGKLDEAVAVRDRIRQIETGDAAPAAVPPGKDCVRALPGPGAGYRGCQKIEVLWGNKWMPAEVLQVRGNQFHIHYAGWNDTWNEWVPDCRVRPCTPSGPTFRR